MKKFLLIVLALIFIVAVKPAGFTYKLHEGQKLVRTYSFKAGKNQSVYLIVARNTKTKKFEAIPFLDNGSGNPAQLATAVYNNEPAFIAKHLAGNTLTLIDYSDKTLTVNDIAVDGGTIANKKIDDYPQPVSVFDGAGRTVIYTADPLDKKEMVINEITDSKAVRSVSVKVDEKDRDTFKRISKHYPTAINTNEFVKNGSATDTRAYLQDNSLIIAYDDPEGTTQALTIDTTTGTTAYTTYANTVEKQKNLTSYVLDNNIVSVANSKDDFSIKAFDRVSGNAVASYSLKKDLAQFIKQDTDVQKMLKTASKSEMKTTFTLNRAGNDYLATVDVVNIYTYQYQFNWGMYWMMYWQQQNLMMMQQNMMIQQQQTINRMHGPFVGCNGFYYEVQKDYSFTIPFSHDFKVMDKTQDLTTDYAYIDHNKMMKPYMDNKKMSFVSADYLDSGMRVIYYSKDTKEIVMETVAGP